MSRRVSCLAVAVFLSSAAFLSSTTFDAAVAQNARAAAQAVPASVGGCPAPPAVLKLTQPNIFSEQQEQWLGDAMADQIERYFKPVKDPVENEYLDHIVKRLLAALPPTKIQFHVVLIDSPEINAFSIAGGHIYVFRKLVANAKNEDEVASVIGHEMGHILSHQFAIETTADMQRLLGVTSVGDKADVYAKFQRLVDARLLDKHPSQSGNSDEKQDEADTVSMYAIAAAGYHPQAFAEFWDRMFYVDGKVGGPLSDFFGVTKPEQKRLREIRALVNALPPGCGAATTSDSAEFEHWRSLVVANQAVAVQSEVKAAAEVALTPPLRMDLDRLRFSRDGKYILAQDESSISVLSREPFQQLFRFDAEKALPAEFSPDSERIVFHTPGLHTEEWSVKDRKLIASHEPVTRQECLQSKFSPDGRTLFCLSAGDGLYTTLTMLDAASGEVLYQKKDYFEPTYGFIRTLYLIRDYGISADIVPSSFSADGNVLLFGPASDKLAFDLRTRKPISTSLGLKLNIVGAYAFLGNDKVVGVGDGASNSGVFGFPDGKRQQPAPFLLDDLDSVTDGNYVLSHNITDYAVGLIDVAASKFIIASKTPAMDVYNGLLLSENVDGSVGLHKIGDKSAADQSTMLPLSPLGPSVHAYTSSDGRFLALNTRTRGCVWDLNTGERVLLANHFNSAAFAPDNTLYIDFPKLGKQERAMVQFEFAPLTAKPLSYKMEDTMRLSNGMLQEWKSVGKDRDGVELIVHSVSDNSVLWRRTFDEGEPAHTYNLVLGETILAFRLKSSYAKARLKANPTLAAQADAVKSKDSAGVIQEIDNTTGNILHELVLEVPVNYDGLDGINIVGDSLYLTSADNRTMVYSMATGVQNRQVFGYVVAVDAASGRVCTVNRSDEAIVYDAAGKELAHFNMGSPIRFAAFKDSGQGRADRLILLTADQKVRTMAIDGEATAAKQ